MNRKSVSIILSILLAALAAIILILVFSIKGSANSAAAEKENIRYISIEVNSGDSLWSISGEYAESCGLDIREYVEKLKKINRLNSDKINEGMSLIVVTCE